MDESLGIGELAARSGLAPSALRHYESLRLLSPARDAAGRRRYDPSATDVLSFVATCRSAGFALAEIAGFIADQDRQGFKRRVQDRRAELAREAAEIERTRALLARAADCRCEALAECVLVPAGSDG